MIYLIIGWPLEIYDKMGMHPSTRCEIKADGCHISMDYQSALKPKGMASTVSFKFGEEWMWKDPFNQGETSKVYIYIYTCTYIYIIRLIYVCYQKSGLYLLMH